MRGIISGFLCGLVVAGCAWLSTPGLDVHAERERGALMYRQELIACGLTIGPETPIDDARPMHVALNEMLADGWRMMDPDGIEVDQFGDDD